LNCRFQKRTAFYWSSVPDVIAALAAGCTENGSGLRSGALPELIAGAAVGGILVTPGGPLRRTPKQYLLAMRFAWLEVLPKSLTDQRYPALAEGSFMLLANRNSRRW
jgi:hypothetical protein